MVNNGLLELMNLFNGGALESFTVFATGITPYITASIVIQLLTVAIPKLEQLSKEGEEGRKKLNQYTRIMGIVLAVLTSIGTTISMQAQYGILNNPSWYTYLFIAIIPCGRHRLHNVVWRAYHGAGYWKRYLPADLYQHCFHRTGQDPYSLPEHGGRNPLLAVVAGAGAAAAGYHRGDHLDGSG